MVCSRFVPERSDAGTARAAGAARREHKSRPTTGSSRVDRRHGIHSRDGSALGYSFLVAMSWSSIRRSLCLAAGATCAKIVIFFRITSPERCPRSHRG
jgi:hypothetical protein